MEMVLHPSLAISLLYLLLARRNIAFAYLDSDGRIRLASHNLMEFAEEKLPSPIGVYLPDLFFEFLGMEEMLQAILRGAKREFRLAPVARETPDGKTRYLSLTLFHIEYDATLPGLLLVEDITREGEWEQRLVHERNEVRLLNAELQRVNAELRRLNDFKSTILSMVAHDLRSPLAALTLRLNIMMEELESGEQKQPPLEMLRWMRYSVGRMNYLLSGLLDREQAERGALRLSFVPCDLVRVLRNVISMAPPDLINRIELKGPKKLELKADERRLYQIFYNLIENALKYVPSDQNIPVNIYQQGDWAVVEISDRGKALPQEEIAKLFQTFYRTEEAQKSGIPGTGLGLFIVKMLVEAHGGRVEVKSQPDYGTTFTVYLPIRPAK